MEFQAILNIRTQSLFFITQFSYVDFLILESVKDGRSGASKAERKGETGEHQEFSCETSRNIL